AEGRVALHLAGMSGWSARSRRPPEEQAAEFRVLDYLAAQQSETTVSIEGAIQTKAIGASEVGTSEVGTIEIGKGTAVAVPLAPVKGGALAPEDPAAIREETLRVATRVSKLILSGMVRK